MCECVNIQYKRLEQLSGANPQTQPGVSDFIWQLAASEDSSRLGTTGEAGRSPSLPPPGLSGSLSDTAGRTALPSTSQHQPCLGASAAGNAHFISCVTWIRVGHREESVDACLLSSGALSFFAKPHTPVLFASTNSVCEALFLQFKPLFLEMCI